MAGAFQVHCPSFQSMVIATRGEVVRRPAADPTSLTTDSRGIPAGACFVALRGETFDGHAFVPAAAQAGAAMAVVESLPDAAALAALPAGFGLLRVQSTRAALGSIAHAWRTSIRRLRVVGITGSAGKTTTRRLMEGILAEVGVTHASPKSFNNDVGVPLTLLSTPDDASFLVAEIGMNHPGEILPLTEMAEPEAGIITLAGRAHLEGMGSVEAVAKEKASLLSGVAASGVGVVNGDNPPLLDAVARLVERGAAPGRIILFGLGAQCDYRLIGRRAYGESDPVEAGAGFEQEIEVLLAPHALDPAGGFPEGDDRRRRFRLRMAGEHNARNALAAIATAYEMGIPESAIGRGVAAVAASDMRLEKLVLAGRTVYNDAYNANPDAMIASLKAFSELAASAPRRVVILGEMRELGSGARELHAEVGGHAGRALGAGDALVAVGPHAEALVAGARQAGFAGDALHAGTFRDQFALEAAALAPPGTAILLKGSRGARMERFVAPLSAGFGADAGVGCPV